MPYNGISDDSSGQKYIYIVHLVRVSCINPGSGQRLSDVGYVMSGSAHAIPPPVIDSENFVVSERI